MLSSRSCLVRLWCFLLAAAGACCPLPAAEGRPGSGPASLASALAVLKVNDPRLLDREATQFAAGLGINPQPMRSAIANLLFRSRTLDGIDLTRSALMAWRSQEPSLVAIIPLSDRRSFLDSFGAGFAGDAPLIRVGEREGTVVYTQNGNDGLLEYRLLVSDRAAYLASSLALCRELAEFPLQLNTSDAPLVFKASAAFLERFAAERDLDPEQSKMIETLVPGFSGLHKVVVAGWQAFLTQLSGAELSVRPDGQGTLTFSLQLQAKSDSALAVWIANQRNQPSRLLPLVRSERSVFTAAGQIVWQGQAERIGKLFVPALQQFHAERWTAMVDENWTAAWALFDRSGPFATAVDIDLKGRAIAAESRVLIDQPKAQELMSLITLASQNLTGTVGEVIAAGNASGYREQDVEGDRVLVANERHLVNVRSTIRPALEAATEVITRSQTIGAPEGQAGVLHLTASLTPLVRTLVVLLGGELQPGLPNVACGMTIKTGLPGQLIAEGTFPAPAVAQLLRDSGFMQFIEQGAPDGQRSRR